MSEYNNPIDQLFDEDNDDNIVLYNENGEPTEFEQIAIIPYDDSVFCILRPLDMEEIAEDEALVFEVLEDEDGEASLDLVTDEETVDKIFEIYYKLLDEEEE